MSIFSNQKGSAEWLSSGNYDCHWTDRTLNKASLCKEEEEEVKNETNALLMSISSARKLIKLAHIHFGYVIGYTNQWRDVWLLKWLF